MIFFPDQDENTESDSIELSRCAREFKAKKVNVDVDLFSKYFPEVFQTSSEQEEPCPQTPSDTTPVPKDEALSSNLPMESAPIVAKAPPVVIIPTGLQTTSSSNTETLSQSKTSEVAKSESKVSLNTASNFVEEPAPQILGHISLEKPEPLYAKALSVDRYV